MKILFAASEVAPFAKTGGLADVAGALPGALKKLGHDVRIVMPYYRCVAQGGFAVKSLGLEVAAPISDRTVKAAVHMGQTADGVPVYFLDQPAYFDRPELYRDKQGDYPDNAERFLFFSKAIVALAAETGFYPDLLHANDWQTGFAPLWLACTCRDDARWDKTRAVFTVHNMAYQGIFWHLDMHLTNLSWDVFTPEILEFYGKINLLKAGIVAADAVTTVSRKYAQEIQTPEYGCGLEGVLQARKSALTGILNGVDYAEWGPENDKHIAKTYRPGAMDGKRRCREDLLRQFRLRLPEAGAVIGMISRLADQKGWDITLPAMQDILARETALIVLGSGEEKYQAALRDLQRRYPDRVGLVLGFDNALAHKIEAGSDLFLMPSRFEPCGLNQIYSMRYGTLPVVRATGGLDDTVRDFDPGTGQGNGFKFQPYTTEALLQAVDRALETVWDSAWKQKAVENAMACDFSWDASAKEYERLYAQTLGATAARIGETRNA